MFNSRFPSLWMIFFGNQHVNCWIDSRPVGDCGNVVRFYAVTLWCRMQLAISGWSAEERRTSGAAVQVRSQYFMAMIFQLKHIQHGFWIGLWFHHDREIASFSMGKWLNSTHVMLWWGDFPCHVESPEGICPVHEVHPERGGNAFFRSKPYPWGPWTETLDDAGSHRQQADADRATRLASAQTFAAAAEQLLPRPLWSLHGRLQQCNRT